MSCDRINNEDILQEVHPDRLNEFCKKLTDGFPESLHAHAYLSTLIDWKRKVPHEDINILAPHGDPNLGVAFFSLSYNMFNGSFYANDREAAKKLEEALAVTKKIPYLQKEMCIFTCMNDLSFSAVEKITSNGDWLTSRATIFWLPWYLAMEMEVHIPDGVEIRELTQDHAKQIDMVWPHRYPGSEELIRQAIELNFGFGVFRGDSLLSWALLWFYGGIGVVQTMEEEKRKGYGRAVVEAITKRMGEMQMDVHLNVVNGNTKGEAFFKALGFRFAFSGTWAFRPCPFPKAEDY